MTQHIKELEDEKKEENPRSKNGGVAACAQFNQGFNSAIAHLTPIVQKLIEQADKKGYLRCYDEIEEGRVEDKIMQAHATKDGYCCACIADLANFESRVKQAKQQGRDEAIDYLAMKLDGLTVLKKDKEFFYVALKRAREGKSMSNPYNPPK